MVDAGKELAQIALQHIAVTPCKCLCSIQRAMRPLAYPVCITIMDEIAFKDRLDQVTQGMMHHAVAEGRRRDQTPLRLMDIKAAICAGLIGEGT